MPLFLFMVGVSMAFSMKKYAGPGLKWKILSRTAKLFVLGCLTQGSASEFYLQGDGVDLSNLRIPGILQRIAFAYHRRRHINTTVWLWPRPGSAASRNPVHYALWKYT